MTTNHVAVRGKNEIARPLRVLVPLIKEEVERADAAGYEHYRKAGEMLLEAREQVDEGGWGSWITRNFQFSQHTARRWMTYARAVDKSPSGAHKNLQQTVRANESRGPVWQAPVQATLQRIDIDALKRERENKEKEEKVLRTLANELIDIGYKVLATKLHPDKGGSPEAMARLNRVRALLKQAV